MYEAFLGWFLRKPERITESGRTMFLIGGALLISGLLGHVATAAADAVKLIGKLPQGTRLAEMYPTWPLWWVPESFVGFFLAAILMALGVWLVVTGKRLRKYF